jgi:hypothetical protein
MDTQISRVAREHLDHQLRHLAPDGEPTPFMVAGGPHGFHRVELHSLTDRDFSQTATTVIPAFIVLNEAIEVVLVAFTTDPDITGGKTECALLTRWGPQGRSLFISEVTRRASQPPVLSGWLPAPVATDLGPIDDGVRRGRDMVRRIWDTDADGLRARIDAIRSPASTTDSDILPLTLDALRQWGWLE